LSIVEPVSEQGGDMTVVHATEHLSAQRTSAPVNWPTIAVTAILVAYVNGFWVTSLQGAVGSFARAEPPFTRWLRDSTLMLPLFVLAVLAAVMVARRLVGQSQRPLVKVGTTALLIVLFTSALSISEVAASSAWDYQLQSSELEQVHSGHLDHEMAAQQGAGNPDGASICDMTCAARRSAFTAHLRAVQYASLVLLITNVLLVGSVLAVRSDRLWGVPASVRRAGSSSPTLRPGCGR